MAITIGGATFPRLTAQPFGYDESDTRKGRTARRWSVSGYLKHEEWLALLGVYDGWRNLRINDPDSVTANDVGNTVSFSGTGPGGQSWSNVPCWFSVAPSAEPAGKYLLVSVEVVDASQALEVLLRAKEEEDAASESDLPDLGTVQVGTATLKLLRPMGTYRDGPGMELTTTGVHYITGPLVPQKVRDIEGTTDLAGWNAVKDWYEEVVTQIPETGDWFPIGVPTASAAIKTVEGVKVTEYTVSIQLGLVI